MRDPLFYSSGCNAERMFGRHRDNVDVLRIHHAREVWERHIDGRNEGLLLDRCDMRRIILYAVKVAAERRRLSPRLTTKVKSTG